MNGMGRESFKAILIRSELTHTVIALSMITLFLFLTAVLVIGYKFGQVKMVVRVVRAMGCTLAAFIPISSLRS